MVFSHKKRFSLLTAILAVAVLSAGCPSERETANKVTSLLANEAASYEAMLRLHAPEGTTLHGEHIANSLSSWATNAQTVARELRSLAEKLEESDTKAKDRASPQTLETIRSLIEAMLRRQVDIRITVPRWQLTSAQLSLKNLIGVYRDMPALYARIFSQTTSLNASIDMEIVEDDEMVDTKPLCEQELRLHGSDTREPYCSTNAYLVCTHQMDLMCLKDKLLMAARQNLTCEHYTKDTDGRYKKSGMSSSWYSSIRTACQATSPVTRLQ